MIRDCRLERDVRSVASSGSASQRSINVPHVAPNGATIFIFTWIASEANQRLRDNQSVLGVHRSGMVPSSVKNLSIDEPT